MRSEASGGGTASGGGLVCALALALITLLPTAAHAGRCHRAGVALRAPIGLNLDPADFGAAMSPCVQSVFALGVRGALGIGSPAFYGIIGGEGTVTVGVVPADNWQITASWTAVQFSFVQNVSVVVAQPSIGAMTLAVQRVAFHTDRWQLTPYVRGLLPTASNWHFAVPWGVEGGVSLLWAPDPRVSLFAHVALPVSNVSIDQRRQLTFTPRIGVDAAFFLSNWLEPSIGIEARFTTDTDGALQYIAPRAALRVHFGGGVTLQLAGMLPLAGIERTNARVALTFGSAW